MLSRGALGRGLPSARCRVLLLLSCVLALSSNACDRTRPSTPTSPSAPTPPAPPSAGTPALSGTVVERFSGRPVPEAFVSVYPLALMGVLRTGSEYPQIETQADGGGRYSFSHIPAGWFNDGPLRGAVWVIAGRLGYVPQCPTVASIDADNTIRDVTLTSRENLALSNSDVPPRQPGTRTVSGVVFEVSEGRRLPVDGAYVGFLVGWVNEQIVDAAWTYTDASGHYVLCGLPESQLTLTAVDLTRHRGVRQDVNSGSDSVIDIELN
jgi:hypothetical protein